MKKICFIFFLLMFAHYFTISQNFWAYTAGGVKEDEAMDICYDNNGNIISVGYFAGPTTFATGITMASNGLGVSDIYISKSNANGQVLWAKKAGGSGSDRATSVAADANGNIFITGFFYGTATFGSITLTSVSGSQDGFIAKLDMNGNFIWAESFGGTLAEWGNSITVDVLGNPIVTGQFQGTTSFSGTNLTSMINPGTLFSSFDVFVAKYSSSGNLVWVKQGKAKYDDRGLDLITDDQNNVYVCGQFSDTIQFQYNHNNTFMNSIFIIKYDANGQEQWFRKAAGVMAIAYNMVIDNTNNIYVTGDFQGTLTYFGLSGSNSINGQYLNKVFLMKINNNGNFIWGKADASNNYLSSKNVALDSNQDPYIFGEFGCTHTEYSTAYGAGIFNSIGFQDFFITKYNNSGTRQWFRHYGGPRNDKAHGLLVGGINEPIMAGSYETQLNIPNTNNNLISANSMDYITNVGPVQPSSYCSAPNNYNDYYSFKCKGYSDAFIFKGIDLTRNPYDYFERSGSQCNLGLLGNCISDRHNTVQCPDTIQICFQDSISANTHTEAYHYSNSIGPLFHYIWNNNTIDTLQHLLRTVSGFNTVKVTTIDGCYTSYDTAYVKVNPLPAPPTITDNLGINQQHLPDANSITICGPATLTLTAGNLQNNSFQWIGPTVSTPDSSAIVDTSAIYKLIVTTSFNCKDTNLVRVSIDAPLPTIIPKSKTDSIEICTNHRALLIICDSITNPTLNYPYSCIGYTDKFIASSSGVILTAPPPIDNCDLSFFAEAASTGMYHYTIAYVFNNACGSDTLYFTDSLYIKVKLSPNANINISGTTIICPGDSTLLVATLNGFNSSNIIYTISPNDSMNVSLPDNYYFYAQLTDTISGCIESINNLIIVQNKPNPFIILNPYNGIICPNDSIKLTINLPGAITYEWHGPGGLISVNNQSIYGKTAGYYHCIVTDNTGCVFTTNSIEIKHYATPYIMTMSNNIICNNQPINLHVVTLDSTLITWNFPLSGGGATKLITNPGVYSCQVTMCGITTTLSINILGSNPIATITTATTSVCPYDSIILSGNAGMSNYIWQPGNHLGQNYIVHSAGSYTLQVTDVYGCSATSTAITISFNSSIAPPTLISNDTTCSGQTAILTVTNTSGNQIDWYPNSSSGAVLASGNTYTTPIITNQTTYYAASVSASGCHSIGVPITAYIYSTSLAPLLIADTTICLNDSLKILGSNIPGASYNWTGPGITTNTTNVVYVANTTTANAGLYTFQTSGFGCTSPTTSITINILNPIAPIISVNDSICENSFYVYPIDPILTDHSYDWIGPNSFLISNDSLIIINATLNHSGTYSVTSNLFGCTSTTSTLQLTVLETPQTTSITTNAPICVGDTLFLSTQPNTNYTYNWFGENGFTSQQTNTFVVATDTSYSGYYGVVVTNIFCPGIPAYNYVTVLSYPSMITSNDTLACDNVPLNLSCQSNTGNYLWSTESTSSTIPVTQSGTYWVSSQNGFCIKTDSIHVTIAPCSNFEINVFTPNGDGINDIFMFSSPTIIAIKCEIRNRWGEKVGEFEGKENGWDGYNMRNNSYCEEGTYFYAADIITIEGISVSAKGFITLFR